MPERGSMLIVRRPPKVARLLTLALLIVVVVFLFLPPAAIRTEARETPDPSVIRITPAAPLIDDATRLSELANRRARVAQAIGSKAMLVLFSAEPRLYANDVDYQY